MCRTTKDRLIRRLALIKLCEMRQAGMSRREIRLRLGVEGEVGQAVKREHLLFDAPIEPRFDSAHSSRGPQAGDRVAFLHALDALDVGLAFFTCTGILLHANRALTEAVEASESQRLRAEIDHFAGSLCSLVRLRALDDQTGVEEMAVREIPLGALRYRLKGSFIGLDLFGTGSSLLITLEKPAPDPLSDEALRERFGLSRKECKVLGLLVQGKTNEEIAKVLLVSSHTIRSHTEHIFRKLHVHSRAEVAARVLRG